MSLANVAMENGDAFHALVQLAREILSGPVMAAANYDADFVTGSGTVAGGRIGKLARGICIVLGLLWAAWISLGELHHIRDGNDGGGGLLMTLLRAGAFPLFLGILLAAL